MLLLYELGLRPSDFDRLAESRPEIFQMGIVTMRRKLKFLQDTIGLRWGGAAGGVGSTGRLRLMRLSDIALLMRGSPAVAWQRALLPACTADPCQRTPACNTANQPPRRRPPLPPLCCRSNAQLAKVISKFPRILEYRSERTLRPRLDFLARCGVSQDDLAKARQRSQLSCCLRN